MKRIPRLLPLVAVAIVGVLAVNFMAGARNLPEMLGAAKAFAEAAIPKGKEKAAEPKAAESAAAKTASPLPGSSEGGAPAITPAALAANADALCSPAEMKFLTDLQQRRSQLDAREGDMDTQLKLIEAAELKFAARVTELNALKGEITKLLGQVDEKQAAETARLVKVYSNMKPQQAAATMATLSDEVRLPIAAQMKELNLSAILNKMTPAQAKDLTEKMAQRMSAAKAITEARAATAPPAAAPAQAAAPATPPAKQAEEKAAPRPAAPAPKRQAARPPAPKAPTAPAPKAATPPATDAAATPPATG